MAHLAICLLQPGLYLQGASPLCTAHWHQLLPHSAFPGPEDPRPDHTQVQSSVSSYSALHVVGLVLQLSTMFPLDHNPWLTQ